MAVNKEERRVMAQIFAQLIRGEIWDTDYESRKNKLFAGVDLSRDVVDDAVEEACIWGELLCADYFRVKYAGERALPPEFRQRLEELVRVLESGEEYARTDPFAEMEHFNKLWPPHEPTLGDLCWGMSTQPLSGWVSDVNKWLRRKKEKQRCQMPTVEYARSPLPC
jgi:hypothetical protein